MSKLLIALATILLLQAPAWAGTEDLVYELSGLYSTRYEIEEAQEELYDYPGKSWICLFVGLYSVDLTPEVAAPILEDLLTQTNIKIEELEAQLQK